MNVKSDRKMYGITLTMIVTITVLTLTCICGCSLHNGTNSNDTNDLDNMNPKVEINNADTGSDVSVTTENSMQVNEDGNGTASIADENVNINVDSILSSAEYDDGNIADLDEGARKAVAETIEAINSTTANTGVDGTNDDGIMSVVSRNIPSEYMTDDNMAYAVSENGDLSGLMDGATLKARSYGTPVLVSKDSTTIYYRIPITYDIHKPTMDSASTDKDETVTQNQLMRFDASTWRIISWQMDDNEE